MWTWLSPSGAQLAAFSSVPFLLRSRVWEFNDEGSIPYVPYLRAPYYVSERLPGMRACHVARCLGRTA